MESTVRYGGKSVVVWGSFSASRPGTIYLIDGSIEQHMYLNTLNESLPLCKQKLYLCENFYFYQDNDLSHKAYNMRSWLLYNCPHVMDTPVQCPDINAIENL